jgi:excisionase family DNA binding protein
MEDRKVTTQQAAEILQVSRDAVFRAVRDGKIPGERIGRSYIIMLSDAQKWFETSYNPSMAKHYPSKHAGVKTSDKPSGG